VGSIISALKFEAYKIDEVNFEMQKIVELLQFKGVIDPESWKLDIKIRNPFFIKKDENISGAFKRPYGWSLKKMKRQKVKNILMKVSLIVNKIRNQTF